jgi:V/A-type H+/Na+-transporting ATPase subunit E
MEDKLRQLAEKLVNDGLVQAAAEQEKMLAEARREAERLLTEAKQEAKSIRQKAEQEAEQERVRVRSELQQLGRRTKEGLRADLRQLIHAQVLHTPLKVHFQQQLPAILTTVIQHLYRDEKGRLEIRLPENTREDLRAQLEQAVQQLLETAPKLGTDARIGNGFSIQRAGDAYVIDFTEADFEAVLAGLMSESLQKLLSDAD